MPRGTKTKKLIEPPVLNPIQIGRRVRETRVALNWQIGDQARVIGLSCGHMSAIESGSRLPGLVVLLRLSAALRRTTNWLLFGRYGKTRRKPPTRKRASRKRRTTTSDETQPSDTESARREDLARSGVLGQDQVANGMGSGSVALADHTEHVAPTPD